MGKLDDAEIMRGLDAISRIMPSQQEINRAIGNLRRSLSVTGGRKKGEFAAAGLWTAVLRSRVIKFAAAAAIAGLAIGAVWMWYSRSETVVRPVREVVQGQAEKRRDNQAVLAREPAEVEHFYTARNVAGLVLMLGSEHEQVRVEAANFLADIGDGSAVEPLEKASAKWRGQGENPFSSAIESIKKRRRTQSDVSKTALTQQREAQSRAPVLSAGGGLLVHVRDKKAAQAISDANLYVSWHCGVPAQTRKAGIRTNEDGYCRLDFNGEVPAFIDLWVAAAGYVPMEFMWYEDMPKPGYYEFSLAKGTQISGRVVDEQGKPIKGVRVGIYTPWRKSRQHCWISIKNYGARTDKDGRWWVDILPAGETQIGLQLSCPGYADDKEPRKPGRGYTIEQLRCGSAVMVMGPSRIVLSGVITDAQTGEPVTDAQVDVSNTRGGHTGSAAADANGFYFFEQKDIGKFGDCRVNVTSNDYVRIMDYGNLPVVHLDKDERMVKDFQLTRACMIELDVVDEQGEPIEKAQIQAMSLADQWGREVRGLGGISTNAKGSVLLGGFAPSDVDYLIIATHRRTSRTTTEQGTSHTSSYHNYAPGHLTVKLKDPNVIEYGRIVLKKGVEVKGYAEYADGVPASDIKVSAYPQWWQGFTSAGSYEVDANGNFTFEHIVPGMYRVQAMIPHGESMWTGHSVAELRLPLADGELLTVKVPGKSPQSLVSISGRVKFAEGLKPTYVHINAYNQQGDTGSGYLEKDWQTGQLKQEFVIDRLEPGIYQLRFDGQGVERKVIDGVQAPSDGLVVELEPSVRPMLQGRVIDANTGEPVVKFRARVGLLRRLSGSSSVSTQRWYEFANSEGRFNIETVGPGIYQVQIAAEGYASSWSDEVNPDENTPVVVELTAGGGIRGTVVDENGKLVSGAKVTAISETVEAVDGVFELEHLAPGPVSLKAVHKDYTFSEVDDIKVEEGKITDGVEIVLKKGGTVQGYVYDVQGRPERGVPLFVSSRDSSGPIGGEQGALLATVTTDSNGFYRAASLPEQLCYIKRKYDWSLSGVISRAVVPKNGGISRVDFGLGPAVSGRIEIEAATLGNHRLELCGTSSPYFGVYRSLVTTDSDGSFTFNGAAKGLWSIYYEDPDKKGRWLKAATFTAGENDIDLGLIGPELRNVVVSVEYEQGAKKWDITRALLREGTNTWGSSARNMSREDGQGQVYVAKNIAPGTYTVTLMRPDYVLLREKIEVGAGDVNATARVPRCTASISGRLVGKGSGHAVVWRKDKKIVGYIIADSQGTYRLDNLPPGQYLVGGNMLIEAYTLLDFDLAAGENKVIDIETSAMSNYRIGSLRVVVVDENGAPLGGTQVWLEGYGGIVKPLTESGGVYDFLAEPGTYVLHASRPDYEQAASEATVRVPEAGQLKRKIKPLLLRLERTVFH